MLHKTAGADSAAARQLRFHAMLALAWNRRDCNKHMKTIVTEKHIIAILKLFGHPLVCDMCPSIAGAGTERPGVGGDITNSEALCVVHGITIAGEHLRCKHGSLITMMPVTFFYACNNYARRAPGTLFARGKL